MKKQNKVKREEDNIVRDMLLWFLRSVGKLSIGITLFNLIEINILQLSNLGIIDLMFTIIGMLYLFYIVVKSVFIDYKESVRISLWEID